MDQAPFDCQVYFKDPVEIKDVRDSDYAAWIRVNEPSLAELKKQFDLSRSLKKKIFFSIVCPVYNPAADIFKALLDSLREQTYPYWELCLGNGNPNNVAIATIIRDYSSLDDRIKCVDIPQNLGIAQNTNEAIKISHGNYVGFVDHDDLLLSFALFEVAAAIIQNYPCELIYSDEDKIDDQGKVRFDPYFKSDFNLDLLRSNNYMPHFLVVKREIGEVIGWLKPGYDGSQDYDFILRCVEQTTHIQHIPKILYHWRAIANSTSSGADAKIYTWNAGQKALTDHLNRLGIEGEVVFGYHPNTFQIKYHHSFPLVSIIIPNRDQVETLKVCIKSIFEKTIYPNYEIILIENGSQDIKTFVYYAELMAEERVTVYQWTDPFNFSAVNNFGAQKANGDLLLFLNNDIEVINSDWLDRMVEYAVRPDIGAVGAKLYYPTNILQHGGVIMGLGGIAEHYHKFCPRESSGHFGLLRVARNVSAVTGACLLIRKNVFFEVNGFDKKYPIAFGDIDFCLTLRKKGYLNAWTPYAELYHYESLTRGLEDNDEKRARFQCEVETFLSKWHSVLEDYDPYYNPNATLFRQDHSVSIFGFISSLDVFNLRGYIKRLST